MTMIPVSDEFVAALREAPKHRDTYVRVRCQSTDTDSGAKSTVVDVCRQLELPGCDPDRVLHTVSTPAAERIETYDGTAANYWVAVGQHYMSEDRSPVRTLAALVKPGDALIAHFRIGNTNSYLRDAGLSLDECWIVVYRRKGDGWRIVGDVTIDYRATKGDRMGRMSYR